MKGLVAKTVALVSVCLLSHQAKSVFADASHEAVRPSELPISHALSLHFSSLGLNKIKEQALRTVKRAIEAESRTALAHSLESGAVGLDQGYIEQIEWKTPEPIQIENLPVEYKKYKTAFKTIRRTLEQWLVGFHLKSPWPQINLSGLSYQFEDLKIELETPPELSQFNAGESEVAIALNIRTSKVRIAVNQFTFRDLNNAFLGKSTMRELTIETSPESPKIEIECRGKVLINRDGLITFSVQDISQNLSEAKFQSNYRGKLELPKVVVRVGTSSSTLNTGDLDKVIRLHKDAIIESLVTKLSNGLQLKLPNLLQAGVSKYLSRSFEQRVPLNSLTKSEKNPIFLNLTLERVINEAHDLSVVFAADMVDPLAPNTPWPWLGEPQTPPLNQVSNDQTDFATLLNIDVINRFVKLNHDRGQLGTFRLKSGVPLKLVTPPRFEAESGHTDEIALNLFVEQETVGFKETMALHSPYHIQIKAWAKVRPTENHLGFNIVLDRIDAANSAIPSGFLRAPFFEDQVASGLQTKLLAINRDLATTPTFLGKDIGLIKNIAGLNVKIDQVSAHRNGYLIFDQHFEDVQTMNSKALIQLENRL